MDTETEKQKEQEADAEKLQQAMFLRYRPQEGRADRLTANLLQSNKRNQ